MTLKAIVAMDPNGAIGRDGGLPWHYPADLRFFKRTTRGNTVVMGRRTWASIGRPLPERLNIVLTRRGLEGVAEAAPGEGSGATETAARANREELTGTGVIAVASADDALRAHAEHGRGDLYVIGGAQVYAAFARRVDEWIVTRIPEPVADADTFLPDSLFAGFERYRSEEIGDGLVVDYLRRA